MNRAPVYTQLAETIKGRILRNEYRAGELISSAREIEQEFAVSAITVRKAMHILVQEGWLARKQGVGTRVTRKPEELVELELSGNFWDWAHAATTDHLKTETDVLEITMLPCPKTVSERLNVKGNEPIWRMKRVRKINGKPLSFIINYADPDLMSGCDKKAFASNTFLDVFLSHCGIKIFSVEQRVRAIVADMDISDKLDIDFGDPVFLVENTYLDDYDKPVEVTCIYFRGDRYVYRTKISF